ncbi:hypothetical protein [Glycomyces terrestris]|uniref:Gluconate 2-dehydrogenase subunit 3 family protein n=1 Tax=Glycomyces terrestris TaxID=2493553 RepID=A0A426UZY3_9ACTN|nr:hypothetical protein [Glycomyces terrestris]RRS00163.1 hypothetical protein EIW28_06095 [Glycomyces terrestris]
MRTLRLAGAASAGLLVLGACGSQQGAALFVGDERVPETTIDGYVATIADFRAEQGEDLAIHDYAGDREQVVVYVLYTELGEAVGLEPVSDTGADELETIALEAENYFQQLVGRAEPRALTADEIEAVAAAAATDANVAGYTQTDLELLAGFTDDLAGYVEEYDVSVNPRYGEFDLSPLPSVFPVEVPQR